MRNLLLILTLVGPADAWAATDPSEAISTQLTIGSPCSQALSQLKKSGFADVDTRSNGSGEAVYTAYADRSNLDWSAIEFGCGNGQVKWTGRNSPRSAAPVRARPRRASVTTAENKVPAAKPQRPAEKALAGPTAKAKFKKGWSGQLERAKAMVLATKTYQNMVKPVQAWAKEGGMSFSEAQYDMYYRHGMMSYELFQVMDDEKNELVGFSFPIRRPPYPGAGPDSIISAQDYMLSSDWFIVDVKLDKVLYGDKGLESSWKEIP